MLQDANRVLKRKVSDSPIASLPRKLCIRSLGPHDALDHSQEYVVQLSASGKAGAQVGRSVGPLGGGSSIYKLF
jgi:hypothetical protein